MSKSVFLMQIGVRDWTDDMEIIERRGTLRTCIYCIVIAFTCEPNHFIKGQFSSHAGGFAKCVKNASIKKIWVTHSIPFPCLFSLIGLLCLAERIID